MRSISSASPVIAVALSGVLGCSVSTSGGASSAGAAKPRTGLGETADERRILTTMDLLLGALNDVGLRCLVAHPLPETLNQARPLRVAVTANFRVDGSLDTLFAQQVVKAQGLVDDREFAQSAAFECIKRRFAHVRVTGGLPLLTPIHVGTSLEGGAGGLTKDTHRAVVARMLRDADATCGAFATAEPTVVTVDIESSGRRSAGPKYVAPPIGAEATQCLMQVIERTDYAALKQGRNGVRLTVPFYLRTQLVDGIDDEAASD